MRGAAGRFRAERYPTILGLTAFDHQRMCRNQGLTKRLVIFLLCYISTQTGVRLQLHDQHMAGQLHIPQVRFRTSICGQLLVIPVSHK